MDSPQSGRILFEGEDIGAEKLEEHRRNHVSFVFQNYNLIDYMTPLENVLLTARQEPLEMLKKLGLTEDESKRNVLKLSGGQQQRVAIARALASEAPVILADEPTGNLDEGHGDGDHSDFQGSRGGIWPLRYCRDPFKCFGGAGTRTL